MFFCLRVCVCCMLLSCVCWHHTGGLAVLRYSATIPFLIRTRSLVSARARRASVAKCIHGRVQKTCYAFAALSVRIGSAHCDKRGRASANRQTHTGTCNQRKYHQHTIHSYCPISRSLSRNMRVPLTDMCVCAFSYVTIF